MTTPAFNPGFGPAGGFGYTGGPMYEAPYYSVPKFNPVIYPPLSAPKFETIRYEPIRYEPIMTHVCDAPSYRDVADMVDRRINKLEERVSDSFRGLGESAISLENTTINVNLGIFSDAYGIMPNGRIKHLLDY